MARVIPGPVRVVPLSARLSRFLLLSRVDKWGSNWRRQLQDLSPPSDSAHYLRELAKVATLVALPESIKLFRLLVDWRKKNPQQGISKEAHLKPGDLRILRATRLERGLGIKTQIHNPSLQRPDTWLLGKAKWLQQQRNHESQNGRQPSFRWLAGRPPGSAMVAITTGSTMTMMATMMATTMARVGGTAMAARNAQVPGQPNESRALIVVIARNGWVRWCCSLKSWIPRQLGTARKY
ncbi:hypothetical protein EV426DRAFT_705401 [Tirmania nivea]|nr:hypothetical protein EV426DRAFT_705401 [Tirmania nivea]